MDIVVAYNKNWAIGGQGKMLWHLPDELAHFKRETTGKVCIMGRKTWDSLPDKFKPLQDRLNIVVSKTAKIELKPDAKGLVYQASSLENANNFANLLKWMPLVLIGGGQLYREAIEKNLVHRVIASEVKGYLDVEADTYFPNLEELGWHKVVEKEYDSYTRIIWEVPCNYMPQGTCSAIK